MSVSFYIKNKKKLFGFGGREKILNIEEALLISEGIQQFVYSEEEIAKNPDLLKASLENIHTYLGVYGQSFRGFELNYDTDIQSYSVRINTPSTRADWIIALNYIKSLATYLDTTIECENGKKYTKNNIMNFPFIEDIEFGIQTFRGIAEKSEDYTILEEGILREVCFSKEMIEKILNSSDPISEYENIVNSLNYIEAFSANQSFYIDKNTEEIFGVYVLSENLKIVLPYKPTVDFYRTNEHLNDEKVKRWVLYFLALNKENLEVEEQIEINYVDFIKYLPKEKYEFIDAKFIVVEKMSREEIKEIYKDIIKSELWENRSKKMIHETATFSDSVSEEETTENNLNNKGYFSSSQEGVEEVLMEQKINHGWRITFPKNWKKEIDSTDGHYIFYPEDSDLTFRITNFYFYKGSLLAPVETLEDIFEKSISNLEKCKKRNLDTFNNGKFLVKCYENEYYEDNEKTYRLSCAIIVEGYMLKIDVYSASKEEIEDSIKYIYSVRKE